ncbi:hypothetical protein TUM20983_34790 [Mycobacterium antarcticum]|uniref:WXG100 family type VII secretion target n=1 Tax=Mycolicibacterium sp. TUM20983 TaxID=3023369 RepID=UPI00239D5C9E|nr:WXG100 family type VII secretion target [Mycolicibacterium sp. TUM20983]GLP76369.1 hypothetical protein TUM20983_34790 [Mycolicibacterium sp. TUM20983]
MPKDLEVDPIDLRMSADHMDMHHADLTAAHTTADADIESAQAGWVGASGAALLAKLADWQQATGVMTADIASHGAAFQSAAAEYASVDETSADDLNNRL